MFDSLMMMTMKKESIINWDHVHMDIEDSDEE